MDDAMPKPVTVRGEIEVPPDTPECQPAKVLVVLEDISRADAPSLVVKQFQIAKDTVRGGEVVPFSFEVQGVALNDRNMYSLRAHIDMSGSGSVERGDFVSTQTYPVLTLGHGGHARIKVRRI